MPTCLRAIPLTFVVSLAAPQGAAPQQATTDLPVSLDRIREELAKPLEMGLELDVSMQVAVATFKTTVEQRVYVLPLKEWLEQEFKMTAFERQSAQWAAKCCGVSLDPLFKSLDNTLKRRSLRKIRERIARELAELEAARKKADLSEKR